MTERERFNAVLHFQKADRVPNVEIGYWKGALNRWREEGLPPDMPLWAPPDDPRYTRNSRELTEYFGLDAHDIAYGIGVSGEPSPPRTFEVVEDDGETETIRFSDGYAYKRLKSDIEGSLHDVGWAITNHKDWEKVRNSIVPGWHNISRTPETFPADDRDFAAVVSLPGFFWQLRIWMGFENACVVFYEDPGWAKDMLEFWGDYLKAQCALVLDHFRPEYIQFDEDMSYNHGPMLSPGILRKFLVPQYHKVTSYAQSRGVDIAAVDSDGLNDMMMPLLHEAGINTWLPMEIICRRGHADLLTLARQYPWLRIIGGIDKTALPKGKAAIDAEVAKIRPLVERGGYIPMIDHKVPPEVSLEAYRYYLQKKSISLITTG